jgi:hypothetical protein
MPHRLRGTWVVECRALPCRQHEWTLWWSPWGAPYAGSYRYADGAQFRLCRDCDMILYRNRNQCRQETHSRGQTTA